MFNFTGAAEFVFQSAVPVNTPLWLPGGMRVPVSPHPHQHLVLPDFFMVSCHLHFPNQMKHLFIYSFCILVSFSVNCLFKLLPFFS